MTVLYEVKKQSFFDEAAENEELSGKVIKRVERACERPDYVGEYTTYIRFILDDNTAFCISAPAVYYQGEFDEVLVPLFEETSSFKSNPRNTAKGEFLGAFSDEELDEIRLKKNAKAKKLRKNQIETLIDQYNRDYNTDITISE